MTTLLRCERVERRRPKEKCASKCVRGLFLSAFIIFLAQENLFCMRGSEIAECRMRNADWTIKDTLLLQTTPEPVMTTLQRVVTGRGKTGR